VRGGIMRVPILLCLLLLPGLADEPTMTVTGQRYA
jgi:hypothetical protein